MRVAFANSSANTPRPDPRISAIFGRSFVFDRMNFAARVACSNSPDPDFVFAAMCVRFELGKNPDDRGGNQIGHRPRHHRPDAEFRQLAALLGRQRSDAANLNPDRAEIREAAKRERCDRKTPWVEGSLNLAQLREGHELV